MTTNPDPASSPPLALAGRIATLDGAGKVVDHGVLYCRDGSIVAVQPASAPAPAGFEAVPVTQTRGTLLPGLVELHNHMPYDVLSLWQVPRHFDNRDQWSAPSNPDYHRLVTGPMQVLGADPDVVPAIVRYVEVRALLGGTTTGQGIALAKSAIISHFRGLVRNVESTHDPDLKPAATHIADIDSTDADHFLARISGSQKIILHLSEGIDTHAHDAFEALHLANGDWAITDNLIGIHCLALTAADFKTFGKHGGSMVWSPLSNLLLYGQTADVGAALDAGVPVALGSDWAPSGSKDVLGELKVAQAVAHTAGAELTPLALVRMVTTTPAAMLGWGAHLGSLEAGKRADLLVLDGQTGDPYQQLIDATEADFHLVMINGTPRVGTPGLMHALVPALATPGGNAGNAGEPLRIHGRDRVLNLAQTTADSGVAQLTVAEAINRLTDALADLPAAGQPALAGQPVGAAAMLARAHDEGVALLAASGVVNNHMSPRPHLPFRGKFTGPNLDDIRTTPLADEGVAAAVAAPAPLPALALDPLTAVDNDGYYTALAGEQNIPAALRDLISAH
jgi:5-methylthioadenosine/S-adenosylhomocysteine deaminase